MKISAIEYFLKIAREKHGDIEVCVERDAFKGGKENSTVERIDIKKDDKIGKIVFLDWRC